MARETKESNSGGCLITFLIVEDCNRKLNDITKKLSALGINNTRVKPVSNKDEALSLLKSNRYDFLILDINIFETSDCSVVTKNAGVDLLIELEDSILSPRNSYNIPNTIFVMSEYPEAISNNGETFKKCKVIPCRYSSGTEDWSIELAKEIRRAELKHQTVVEKKSRDIVVYSVHGIQTFGRWQNDFDIILRNAPKSTVIEHIIYKYHHFPLTHFLRSGKRGIEVEKLKGELLNVANRYPESRICIVGHSFGTFIIAESLKSLKTRLNIDVVILAGSVLKSSYDWSDIILKHDIKIIYNECASTDWALVCSHFFAKGLGMAGVEGFLPHNGTIINRHFKGGHSCFFNKSTLLEWSSVINGEKLEVKDERSDAGFKDFLFSLLTKTRKRWVLFFAIIPLSLLGFLMLSR